MFSRVAIRNIAGFLLCLLAALGSPVIAHAQWQVGPVPIDPGKSSSPARAEVEPFGLNSVLVTDGEVLAKWNGVEADIRAERAILLSCREGAEFCPNAAQKFLDVIAQGRTLAGRARIGVINRAINLAIQPMSDLAQWGVPDRWSAPLLTLTTGRGDCEDYAIAKYVALAEAGVAVDDLRLIIVRDLAVGQDHAVVAARLDDKWIVLDNRRFVLVEDSEMRRVQPLFALDHDGVRQFVPTTVADAGDTRAPAPSSLGF
jgi:predicted transglutaminase-like cysteine proteinase